ncbi:MAG: hypothetical protein ABS943_14545, partial [Pantoea agglomerans]
RSRAMQKCSRHFCPGSGTIFKEPASGGFLRSGANPLSKVRFTRHIPVARPPGRAKPRDAKMLPAFSGSGTIFKEPASGGFLLF